MRFYAEGRESFLERRKWEKMIVDSAGNAKAAKAESFDCNQNQSRMAMERKICVKQFRIREL